jgi:hypothetical protein
MGMSIIPTALLELAIATARLIITKLSFRRKVDPIPFGRQHHWSYVSVGTPHCVYCLAVKTDDNEHAICPGPRA